MNIGTQCSYSRYNDTVNYGVPGYWQQPDGKWDAQIGVQMEDYLLGYSTTENVLQDVNLSFGGGLYILLGADIDFSFNVNNFFRVISALEEEQS